MYNKACIILVLFFSIVIITIFLQFPMIRNYKCWQIPDHRKRMWGGLFVLAWPLPPGRFYEVKFTVYNVFRCMTGGKWLTRRPFCRSALAIVWEIVNTDSTDKHYTFFSAGNCLNSPKVSVKMYRHFLFKSLLKALGHFWCGYFSL